MTTVAGIEAGKLAERRPTRALATAAFVALLLRDIRVVRRSIGIFLARVITQPLLVVFVFAYVFPKIGQGIGGSGQSEEVFSTLLAPGLMGVAVIMTGIQSVALPLVTEFGWTREIDDRVMAPLPVWAVAVAKICSGALQSAFAAVVVVPLALTIPEASVSFSVSWLQLITIVPLACLLAGALGLAIGTSFDTRQTSLIFTIIVIPITFLGACYYPWERLEAIEWLKWAVLVNPLVYMSEGFRMALTNIPHMSAWGIYGGLIGFTSLLSWIGIKGFRKQVLA